MRRSRFTVHTASGDRHVILAYGMSDARLFYEQRGHVVTKVVKGDYRAVQPAAGGGFRVDQQALRVAIELLGLKLPVKVRFNSRVGSTMGNYRFRGTHHDIMLKSYHDAAQASSTLWHELTHAMQAERSGGTMETWASFNRDQKRYTYRSRPIEVEARQMSRDMSDCPLCY